MTQKEALEILKTGRNVFLTGAAGSGKTYVLREYIKYLKDLNAEIGVTASTGIAATHMGGVTIHSFSGIGIKDYLTKDDLSEITEKKQIKNKQRERVIRTETNQNFEMVLNAGSFDKSNPPSVSTCLNNWAVRLPSRPSKSKIKRSKLLALEISIDGLEVCKVSADLRAR